MQPSVISVAILRNNHPCKLHLTAPNLTHLTVGTAIVPTVRIVGDCGYFWDGCPPGALKCELSVPPGYPEPVPVCVGAPVKARESFPDEKAYEFADMAAHAFAIPGRYEFVIRLELLGLPYSAMLQVLFC